MNQSKNNSAVCHRARSAFYQRIKRRSQHQVFVTEITIYPGDMLYALNIKPV